MKYLPSRKACELLGVYPNTLRSWAKNEKIDYIKTASGQRKYNVDASRNTEKTRCYLLLSGLKLQAKRRFAKTN